MQAVTATERFWSRVEFGDHCWLWRGAHSRGGYGNFAISKHKQVGAHRFAYEDARGSIPQGLVLDHLCENPGCVNPWHLRPVTHRINILAGNSLSARRARMTSCKYGHPFTDANTHIKPNGHRRCRVCMTHQLQRYMRQKAARRSCQP